MLASVLCTVIAGSCVSKAIAAEVETHEFNAALSLIGGCGTSSADPIADPSCPEGPLPPSGTFTSPRSIATDPHGDIYVASYGKESANGAEGRIDVFSPDGVFITEVADSAGPKSIAVDSKGNLYVFEQHPGGGAHVHRYEPSSYIPASGEIAYKETPVVVIEEGEVPTNTGAAVNPKNDHLFLHNANWIDEFGSAEEGNPLLDNTIGKGVLSNGMWVAIDAAHGQIYASDSNTKLSVSKIRVFELEKPHALLETFDGSTTPEGKFISGSGLTAVAVEESTGHFFVYDPEAVPPRVYEFTESGEYISKIEHSFEYAFTSEIAVDNSPTSENEGTLVVPSGRNGVGHSYAFTPINIHPPIVESVSFTNVTENEVELQATISPRGAKTSYVFEYTTEQSFEEEGFAGALAAGAGSIPAGGEGVDVSAGALGLLPDTPYRFRVVAENEKGTDEGEDLFRTYIATPPVPPCPNDSFRTEASAGLPDCRAYELVTPPDTNGRPPTGAGIGSVGDLFPTAQTSPAGDRVSFITRGGSLPGSEGTGSFQGDPYLSIRTAAGWDTSAAGPNGEEVPALLPGGVSADQGFSFWGTTAGAEAGGAEVGGKPTHYVRYPDGHSELIGRGSLGSDPRAIGKMITAGGDHIVFSTNSVVEPAVRLEEDAPPAGTNAVYDRTGDEVTHVVSLLPGNVTPAAGENAGYLGSSSDGTGIAFEIGNTLYLRHDNFETFEIGNGVEFAGVSANGDRVFYLKGGNLFAFDTQTETIIPFAESGDATAVNVASDGTHAYFVSPSVLTGEENPNGASAEAGEENLYLSKEGVIDFVGKLTETDVDQLGLWVNSVEHGTPGLDPSHATLDGTILLFESRAPLTSYDPKGHVEIYRYDSAAGSLDCLSCNPTLSPAAGEASLQSMALEIGRPEPLSPVDLVPNLRADGQRAFFQSTEPLVPTDTDGLQDVYEWEAQGVGSCERTEGCIYLVSSGHSAHNDYLYAVSSTGDDAFFSSSDLLLPADHDGTPSIYDARVGGGFSEEEEEECEGEGCRPALTPPPALPSPAKPALGASDNVPPAQRCPKGKHRVKRQDKIRCVKKHHKQHRRASAKQKGAGK